MTEPRDHKFREAWWKQVESDPNPELADGLLAAAYAISTKARVDGTRALMSNRLLAQILKKNERTARRHTQKLRDLGYLALAERGGRRGDGTITANIYELSLPDTQMSPWDISQQDTHVSPRDDSQPDKSASQQDIWDSQPDKSASQQDIQMSTPSLNPSLYPSPNPSYIHSPSAVETAVVNPDADTHGSNGASNVGVGDQKQDQKRLEKELRRVTRSAREPEEQRCQIQDCRQPKSKHEKWMALLDEANRHPFTPPRKAVQT